jgi:DNA-binding MltR family transcriptional regulator
MDVNEFTSFIQEFQQETDRAAALLAVAYLDSKLEELLQSKFVSKHRIIKDLFKGQGALSSFSAKVSIAYAVGLISLPTTDDLHHIRKIRNDFAHKIHGLSFQTTSIASRVNALSSLKALKNTLVKTTDGKMIPLSFDWPIDPRRRFNLAVTFLLIYGIDRRISEMPAFQEAQSTDKLIAEEF